MDLLITNDDGINARGILELAKELSKKHEVTLVAPRTQKSACSHSISLHEPIRVREEKIEGLNCKCYSVLGTPADCTQVGIKLLDKKYDMVISGINKGLNTGIDVLYSGTVSAAMEAALYKIPAMAVSLQVDFEEENVEEDYGLAVDYVKRVLNIVEKEYLKNDVVLNLNIPMCKKEDIKGFKVCKIDKGLYDTKYIFIEKNEENEEIYKIKGSREECSDENSDVHYISQGYVTLTPLYFDLTKYSLLNEVDKVFKL
ncbi:5'-nucleotidase /3'-nucleotidase /exopolyphosphatase [Clostridium cavendishii DSM 21758]|uniref:5'-nucleotidase SurE n=1 Tax=Clostridium cavendishii DSM 21758 TaxID=1121302 RepID=A0A1M6V7N0_9CLOT|nr:5'/3'-nucleotidase SurE [Clostridium cavendishii]SHK77470.1 5'-nucleotidase /3'-nucleotidase /exopolyphosphatase [Clostridium cavendishii DSM 21758]